MQRQKDSVNLMTFIKPHQSGFLLSIILAVISVTSGIVPYFDSCCYQRHKWYRAIFRCGKDRKSADWR